MSEDEDLGIVPEELSAIRTLSKILSDGWYALPDRTRSDIASQIRHNAVELQELFDKEE